MLVGMNFLQSPFSRSHAPQNLHPFFCPWTAGEVWNNAVEPGRLPNIRGNLALKGLRAPVQVLRDRWYVPHIYAQSPEDAVFAQGFVHAQERLWQMDFNRRVVAGRLAEILGEGGLLPDRVMRTFGFRRLVEKEAGIMPENLCALAEAYCAGVNSGIDLAVRQRKLPVEFTLLNYKPEPWEPADILGISKINELDPGRQLGCGVYAWAGDQPPGK